MIRYDTPRWGSRDKNENKSWGGARRERGVIKNRDL